MPYYTRVHAAVNTLLPSLRSTQATNLALLISAILLKRTLCLSELVRAYPSPVQRRITMPKHDLLHRLKRLWRFLNNDRVHPVAIQLAMLPHTVARLGDRHWLALAIDWTMFDTIMPNGHRIRYQVVRVAIPRRGRAIPVLHLAYNRDRLPGTRSQNQLEETARAAVIAVLPPGVRPVILADRGFARASFLQWLQQHHLDYVVRLDKGTCLTERDGRRWKLGEEQLRRLGRCSGCLRCATGSIMVAPAMWWSTLRCVGRLTPAVPAIRAMLRCAPWYLATSVHTACQAVAWYWQRGWIAQRFKDSQSRVGLNRVQVQCPLRLTRLLMALTLALTWLSLLGRPKIGAQPPGWHAAVAQRGRASIISLALALLTIWAISPTHVYRPRVGMREPPRRRSYPLAPLPLNGAAQLMQRGCAELGITTAIAANAALFGSYYQAGVGWRSASTNRGFCQAGCSTGAKASMDVTFIPLAIGAGAEVRPACFVTRLEMDHTGCVTGVVYTYAGVEQRQRCYAVFLCASAIETPRMLLLNELANSSGQVGRSFMAHVGVQVWGQFADNVRPYKGIPGGLISEDTHRPKHADFAGGYVLQSIGVMPVTYASQVARGRGLRGQALRDHMRGYNHTAGINVLGDCLPYAYNYLELSDKSDARRLPKPRIHFTKAQSSAA